MYNETRGLVNQTVRQHGQSTAVPAERRADENNQTGLASGEVWYNIKVIKRRE